MNGRQAFSLQHCQCGIDDQDKYSLGGQGQDPKAGLVGPLTQPVQLEGNRNGKFLVRMALMPNPDLIARISINLLLARSLGSGFKLHKLSQVRSISMIFSYCSESPHSIRR